MLVSVIMPTYNCGKYIGESIQSVLDQTNHDWELIIADDCSTDGTKEIVAKYQENHPGIRYILLEKNGGPAAARTAALKAAKGKYVAFLDSDDLWTPEKLEKQIRFMEENQYDFTATAYGQMDAEGKRLSTVCLPPKRMTYGHCIRHSNPIGNLTVMYNREKLGDFEVPPIRKRNDFALWLQVLKKTKACYGMDDVLGTYRLGRQGSVSHNKPEQAKYHWQLYHEIEGHGILRSLFEMGCWAFVKGTGIGLRRRETR